jgi:hypothetical protein
LAFLLSVASACAAEPAAQQPSSPPVTSAPAQPDPGALIRDLATAIDAEGSYRDPTAPERSQAHAAVKRMLADMKDTDGYVPGMRELGFKPVFGSDPQTSRPYVLLVAQAHTERSWGAIWIDLSKPPDLVVEVPHPGFDTFTDIVGVEVFRARPGTVLVVAGAHRHAVGGLADVAHNDRSLFHEVVTTLAAGGLDEVQLHGFADANLPGADTVVSTGSAQVAPLAMRLGAELGAAGFSVCEAWQAECGRLEGTKNVQSQAAAQAATVFVHLEISYRIRSDRSLRRDLVSALVAAA